MASVKNNVSANLFQSLGSAFCLFLLYRQISSHLGLASLGIWSVFVAINSISRLTDFGTSLSVTRFVSLYSTRGNSKKVADIVETSFITIFLVVPLLLCILLPIVCRVTPLFFSTEQLDIVHHLIPITGAVIWINMLATVATGAVDGKGDLVWRAYLITMSQLFSTIIAMVLLPRFGLFGVSVSQFLQGIFVVLFSWIHLVKRVPELSFFPRKFSRTVLKDIFSYSVNVQFNSLASLLFDPMTKLLFLRFGGPEIAAIFEIANQIVMRFRSLLVMANQSIIPLVTEMWELRPEKLGDFYNQNLKMLCFISAPSFTLILVFSSLLEKYFSIQDQPLFLFFLSLSVISWFVNTISAPGYFINIATGYISINTVSHLFMALINIGGGMLLGFLWGPMGVMTAYSAALILGSVFTIWTVQRRVQSTHLNFRGFHWSFLIYILAIVLAVYVEVTVPDFKLGKYYLWVQTICISIVVLTGTWFNPMREEFVRAIIPKLRT